MKKSMKIIKAPKKPRHLGQIMIGLSLSLLLIAKIKPADKSKSKEQARDLLSAGTKGLLLL